MIVSHRQKPFRGTPINPAHPMARGLLHYWCLNEHTGNMLFDATGRLPLAISGGEWRPGGFYTDASGYASASQVSISGSQSFTLFAQFTLSNTYSGYGGAVSFGATLGNRSAYIGCINGDYVGGGAWGLNLEGGYPYGYKIAGKTYDLAMSYDGSTIWLYVDGVERNRSLATLNIDNTGQTAIGRIIDTYPFVGNILRAGVYDRCLSPLEVALLHREPYAMFQVDDMDIGAFEYVVSGGSGPKWNGITPAKWNGIDWSNLKWNGM